MKKQSVKEIMSRQKNLRSRHLFCETTWWKNQKNSWNYLAYHQFRRHQRERQLQHILLPQARHMHQQAKILTRYCLEQRDWLETLQIAEKESCQTEIQQ